MGELVKKTMSQILAQDSIKMLSSNLQLTAEQDMKARSNALTLSSNPKLADIDNFSIAKYCFEIARYNFTRDDCTYPVPYSGKIQFQIGYKGYRELAMRSGKYFAINCSIVFSCDKVIRNRQTGNIEVEFNENYLETAKSSIVGYYGYAVRTDGKISNSLFMTKEEVTKHAKHYSKSFNSIWGDKEFGFDKMARKTIIKQLCMELDQTPELQNAIKTDQIVFGKENEKDLFDDNPQNDIKKEGLQNKLKKSEEIDFTKDENKDNKVIDVSCLSKEEQNILKPVSK